MQGPRRPTGSRAGGSGPRGSKRDPREDSRARARELVQRSGIPWNLAVQVADGKMPLNEAIARLAREQKVQRLEAEHGVERSLAMQVALGQADVDDVLFKQRMKEHLAQNRERSVLVEAQADGRKLGLALHGLQKREGKVLELDAFELVMEVDGAPERIHKLQAKFAYAPGEWKLHKKGIGTDPARHHAAEPVPRPQDRYPCSDRRLYSLKDQAVEVLFTTLEGDTLRGTVQWVGRWEVGLALKGGADATIFRHAIAQVEEA